MKNFWRLGLALSGLCFLSVQASEAYSAEPMFDLSALDRSVDPCSDFYAFSCGGWLSRTHLPADRPSWTRSFSTIQEENLGELRKILEAYSSQDFSVPSQYSKLLGEYYSACINTDLLESTQGTTLSSELALIQDLKIEDLSRVLGQLQLRGYSVLFDIGSSPDYQDSSRMIAEIDQGGLSLPNRDYYFKEEKAPIREKFLAHVTRILELSGIEKEQASKDAHSILAFETELAKNSLSPVERRDPQKVYHLLPKNKLGEWVPHLDWESIFSTLGSPSFDQINIAVPQYLQGLEILLRTAAPLQIQTYLRWHIIHALAANLGKDFREENFNFSGKILSGQKEMRPRWKSCVQSTDRALGDALGEAFVRQTFGEEGKTQTQSILKTVQEALEKTLTSLEWMDQPTRQSAVKKLNAIQNKIGYPEHWTDLSALQLDSSSHIANQISLSHFWTLRTMKKIGQPVDRTEWEMTPSTVNAYYNPQMNEIVFPTGILQSPFYSKTASLASNYGAIAMVIGHELTHGFDDEGRQFDESGNLKDWWSKDVAEVFDRKTQCVVDQYSAYTVADGVHVNGALTLGENIADLGGLKLAYKAFRSVAPADEERAADSFTQDQEFFISFAQSWCTQSSEEYEKLGAATDPHSPPKYRVNGTVTNLPEFERAFRCSPGAPLAPKVRCSIW